MSKKPICKQTPFHCIDDKMLSKTRKRVNRKNNRWYGGVPGDQSGVSGDGGMGEQQKQRGALILELLGGVIPGTYTANALSSMQANSAPKRWNVYDQEEFTGYDDPGVDDIFKEFADELDDHEYEEEAEQTASKIDLARGIFQSMVSNPNITRRDIINAMMQRAGVTDSTAVSYYERIAKEAGLTNKERGPAAPILGPGNAGGAVATRMGGGAGGGAGGGMGMGMGGLGDEEDDLGDEEGGELEHTFPDDPDRQGIIRQVDNAHLVYKRQVEDGTFEELWIYSISTEMNDELDIRKAILAGTDIPPSKTQSNDGSQTYTLTTLGNAQYVHVKGLPN